MRSIFIAAVVAFTGLSAAAPAYHQYRPAQNWRDLSRRSPAPAAQTIIPLDALPAKREAAPAPQFSLDSIVPRGPYQPNEKRAPRYHHAPKYAKAKRQAPALPAEVPSTGDLPLAVPDTSALGGI